MIYVLVSAPGAGKGTQGDLLVSRRGFQKLSAGDELRREVRLQTEIGRQVETTISDGRLVSDDTITEIICGRIEEMKSESLILDGFPRNLSQAKVLWESKYSELLKKVIYIDVDKSELLARLSGRKICSNCGTSFSEQAEKCDKCEGSLVKRHDDEEAKVLVRFETYEEQTLPVLDFFGEKGILERIEGTGTLEDVYKRIVEVL